MNKSVDITDIVLRTPRLTLRPWKMTDLEDLYEYASVDGVGQMAGWKPHRSMEESQQILESFIQGKCVFALELEGKAIGTIGIHKYAAADYPELDEWQGCDIGYVLAKAYWGQGLMPEAVKEVIRWLFEQEKMDFIMVGHFDWNHQSRRVIEKCGFKYIKNRNYKTRFDTTETIMEYILWKEGLK